MEQIEINGLLWDTENLEIHGKKYFTWQEAMDAAKSVGKRLPTKEELEALINEDWEFDKEKKGMWFSDGELFFPLSGNLNYSSRVIQNTTYGYCWSSSPRDASGSWSLRFYSGNAYVNNLSPKYGFPVRCVQDIKSDNSTIQSPNECFKLTDPELHTELLTRMGYRNKSRKCSNCCHYTGLMSKEECDRGH